MSNLIEMIRESVPNQEAAYTLMGRVFEAAKPEAVFSPPASQGEYMVITAAEVTVGLGFGYGGGGGIGITTDNENENAEPVAEINAGDSGRGFGGGGGGGGRSTARPVAAIEIGPNGVIVEPIIDPTKIILAFFTALGAMFLLFSQMKRNADELNR